MTFNNILKNSFDKFTNVNPLFNILKKESNKKESNNKEQFNSNSYSIMSSISSLISLFIFCFAIYLSWSCNGKKFDLIGFIAAFCCSPCYVLYQFFNNGFCGLI